MKTTSITANQMSITVVYFISHLRWRHAWRTHRCDGRWGAWRRTGRAGRRPPATSGLHLCELVEHLHHELHPPLRRHRCQLLDELLLGLRWELLQELFQLLHHLRWQLNPEPRHPAGAGTSRWRTHRTRGRSGRPSAGQWRTHRLRDGRSRRLLWRTGRGCALGWRGATLRTFGRSAGDRGGTDELVGVLHAEPHLQHVLGQLGLVDHTGRCERGHRVDELHR